jgi:hypothetical protein
VETSYLEVMPDIPAMPAFTSAKPVVHQHDTIAMHVNDAVDPDADWGSQFYGNPQYLDLTVPLGLFFSKHPSMYLPIMAIASSQDITIEIRLKDIASLMQHWHEAGSAAGAGSNVSNDAAFKLLTAPVASSKATYLSRRSSTCSCGATTSSCLRTRPRRCSSSRSTCVS